MNGLPAVNGFRARARLRRDKGFEPWVFLALFGLGMIASGCFEAPREPGERETAPLFDLALLDGGHVDLTAQRGKIVVLDFWATWCAPCEVQMPVLDALWKEAGGDELMVLGISVDTDPASEVAEWVEERGFKYPIAIGDQELAMDFGVIGFPSLIVVDRAGRIFTRHTGVWSRPEIEEVLEEVRRAPSEPGASESMPAAG
ncbi:MAG: TlpA family protein disulfide reductase [Myxococcota bacterium]